MAFLLKLKDQRRLTIFFANKRKIYCRKKKNKRENEKENTIINLLIKNQQYLNKSVCNTASDETFKTVTKGPLKQGNNTETNTIIIF